MRFKITKKHIIGLIIGITILILDFVFLFREGNRWFRPLIAVAFLISTSQFWLDVLKENKKQREIELKFLEFVRALVETVKSGIPIPKAIVKISTADYGELTPYVEKLANQIKWGFPLDDALTTFSLDTKNIVIKRSISVVIEAERSGGNVDEVLQAVTDSVVQIKKIKEERKANTYSQIVQGYLVFFVFIGIMLVLQIYLIPQIGNIGGVILTGFGGGNLESYLESGGTGTSVSTLNVNLIFIWLVLIQGFFAGIMIGKFSEGKSRMGLKHSLILMVTSYLIITTFTGY